MDGVTSVISPVGRALQQKLSGMTQEQFQQYVMQQMNAGVIKSFPEIMALKSQYDALKRGAQQKPAPQGTVADEMSAEMAPQPAPPRDAGVATLPEARQGFADGGIVAFAGAGGVGTPPTGPATMTPEEFLQFLEEQKAAREAAARVPPPLPSTPAAATTPAAPKPSAWRTPIKGANLVKGANAMLGPAVATGIASGVVRAGTSKAGEPELREATGKMFRDTDSLSLPVDPAFLANPIGAIIGSPIRSATNEYAMTHEGLIPELLLRGDALGREIASNLTFGRIRSPYSYLEEPAVPAAEKKDEKPPIPTVSAPINIGKPGADTLHIPLPPKQDIPAFSGPEAVKPGDRSTYEKEVEDYYKSKGIGAKDKEYEDQLAADRKEMEYNKRVAPWLALAQAGFRMAQEGSKSGATFLGSAGAGAEEGLKTYKQLKDDIKVANREQQKAERDLATAQELRQMNMHKEAQSLWQDATNRYENIMLEKSKYAMEVAKMKWGYDGQVYSAQIQGLIAQFNAQQKYDEGRQMFNLYINAVNAGDKKRAQEIIDTYSAWIGGTNSSILAAAMKNPMYGGGGQGNITATPVGE